jgi:hypothetical protein
LFKQLKPFAEDKALRYITECDVKSLRAFSGSWPNKNFSARKKLEALRTFFKFVHESGWLPINPAKFIKPPKTEDTPALPFNSTAKPDLSRLGAQYRRLRSKLGAPKAITAMAHRLARLVYRMLKYGQHYVDKGAEYYERRNRQQQIEFLRKKAARLGLQLAPAHP